MASSLPILEDFWPGLSRLESRRPLWLLGGGSALALELFSVAYFQGYLGLLPCELCVLIRLCMLVIFLGAMTAAIKPSSWPLALAGYALSFLGAVRGFGYSYALEGIVAQASYSEFYLAPCRPGGTEFPFGLPLDRWSPAHFLPRGLCGDVSSSWDFLGLSMSAWLMVIYLAYLSGLALMLAARLRFRLAR